MSKNEKKRKSVMKTVGYIIGSLAVGAVASMVVPKYLDKGASYLYKKTNRRDDSLDDSKDAIVKKQS